MLISQKEKGRNYQGKIIKNKMTKKEKSQRVFRKQGCPDEFAADAFRGLCFNMYQGIGNVEMITIDNEEAFKELCSQKYVTGKKSVTCSSI